MGINTKDKILIEALNLFSQKGYDAVSVEEIAKAVGIKAPSLYKHYHSKKEIFDGVFTYADEKADMKTIEMNMHVDKGENDLEKFSNISAESLCNEVKALVNYSLHNEFIVKFRKLMTIE